MTPVVTRYIKNFPKHSVLEIIYLRHLRLFPTFILDSSTMNY